MGGGGGGVLGPHCPLPNPPPLGGGGDCRRFANISLPRPAGEGRGGGKSLPQTSRFIGYPRHADRRHLPLPHLRP
ncbi:hypothetical protein D3093_08350 [Azospirillum argentinense]|uniref:Uncharacterized protein n=1 Tax=Azospirillum argentinense TaxID=2970906 RepID=A0A4D8PIV2_9PROT|nr:hypothetical protein D3093_08350 [Azospirillum argentinense]